MIDQRQWLKREAGGIPQAQLEGIFDRDWHAEPDDRRKATGLGLYIAKAIVEAHRGTIGVDSTPGGGSSFYVTLPRFARE